MNQSSTLKFLESYLPQKYISTDDWVTMKNGAYDLIQLLDGCHVKYADMQITNNTETEHLHKFTIRYLWPDIFSKFSSPNSQKEFRDLYLEIIELGFLITAYGIEKVNSQPRFRGDTKQRNLSQNDFSIEAIKRSLDIEAIRILNYRKVGKEASDLLKIRKEFARITDGLTNKFYESYRFDRLYPFFKFHGVKHGFPWGTAVKTRENTQAYFFLGGSIAVIINDLIYS